MSCCGGGEEDVYSGGPPSNQNTAPPRAGNPYGGGNDRILFRFFNHVQFSYVCSASTSRWIDF